MGLDKPIFIVGVGRSGSTIFHRLLSQHGDLNWLSGLCDRFPEQPEWNAALMKLLNIPLLGRVLRAKFHPGENYLYWNSLYRGFGRPFRDLQSFDVTEGARKRIRSSLTRTTTNGDSRLLIKITGWPRIGFLKEIFPDARFIHMVRDGRAVAASILQVEFWEGWKGPENWRWGKLTEKEQLIWEQHDRSFVTLAGLSWVKLLAAFEESARDLTPDQFTEILYEDLCEDKVSVMRQLIEFLDLRWTPSFNRALKAIHIHNTNHKWNAYFSEHQKDILRNIQGDFLRQYGYE